MKFIASLLLIMILSFAACIYLPWWTIAIVSFVVGALIPQHPGLSFLAGFIALLVLWGGLSFWISNLNQHILANKVAMLILKTGNPYLLMMVTALIGAFVAGFASLTASFIRKKKLAALPAKTNPPVY